MFSFITDRDWAGKGAELMESPGRTGAYVGAGAALIAAFRSEEKEGIWGTMKKMTAWAVGGFLAFKAGKAIFGKFVPGQAEAGAVDTLTPDASTQVEDQSKGVHNAKYARALLSNSIAALD